MANKENELACAGNLPAKLHNDSRTLLLNPSDSGTSQTEGPSSKYSGFFSEASKLLKVFLNITDSYYLQSIDFIWGFI